MESRNWGPTAATRMPEPHLHARPQQALDHAWIRKAVLIAQSTCVKRSTFPISTRNVRRPQAQIFTEAGTAQIYRPVMLQTQIRRSDVERWAYCQAEPLHRPACTAPQSEDKADHPRVIADYDRKHTRSLAIHASGLQDAERQPPHQTLSLNSTTARMRRNRYPSSFAARCASCFDLVNRREARTWGGQNSLISRINTVNGSRLDPARCGRLAGEYLAAHAHYRLRLVLGFELWRRP